MFFNSFLIYIYVLILNLMFHLKLFITLALLTLLTHYFCRLLSWNEAQQICLSHNNSLSHFDEEMGRDFSERVEADKVQTGDVFFVVMFKRLQLIAKPIIKIFHLQPV